MPSVLGLLEAREKKVLEEVARLREEAERAQAALGDAERALQRRPKAKRLVERGWAQQVRPGVFTAFAGPAD
ncbi:hypothetical protein ACFV42_43395 [Streptomyces solisilvae]|uniref:hypothetical protein n=1 Tax=Streptomyces malaysiensis TaxID=92644 RepID=UPI003676285F